MVEKFLEQTTFTSQEDFIKNLKIKIPENFNFGYDIVDAWMRFTICLRALTTSASKARRLW